LPPLDISIVTATILNCNRYIILKKYEKVKYVKNINLTKYI